MSNNGRQGSFGQETINVAKDFTTQAYERASSISHGYVQSLRSYVDPLLQPVLNMSVYLWKNLPPLRWFAYALGIFNCIPIAIFLGWSILTFGFVSALAGVGIVIAQGFFTFLGAIVFLPVACVLVIIAAIGAIISTCAWLGFEATNFGLVQLGVVRSKNALGFGQARAITGSGVREAHRRERNGPLKKLRKRESKDSSLSKSPENVVKKEVTQDILKYRLPKTIEKIEGNNSPHLLLQYLWQSNFSAPIDDILGSQSTILEVRLVMMSWSNLNYPNSEFVGIGMKQLACSSPPPNLRFASGDISSTLLFDDNEFDFVRICYLILTLEHNEWINVINELIRVTKPEGWLEFVEPDLKIENPGPILTRIRCGLQFYIHENDNIVDHLKRMLQSTKKLDEVYHDFKAITLGECGGEVGIYKAAMIDNYFRMHADRIRNQLGISSEEMTKLLEDFKKEYSTMRVQEKFHKFWAKKC
ncbi:18157_t:CDS:2 [Acaulospora morrowiae]|uniref:18157_t:CDS:1 n=1 Tax=Acaulospora morrowiae TaxID=94023 RepID=A0A9N8YXC3_9GLOM|nr:18157_t:CDS:2 [Acaulospora morrowiae]